MRRRTAQNLYCQKVSGSLSVSSELRTMTDKVAQKTGSMEVPSGVRNTTHLNEASRRSSCRGSLGLSEFGVWSFLTRVSLPPTVLNGRRRRA